MHGCGKGLIYKVRWTNHCSNRASWTEEYELKLRNFFIYCYMDPFKESHNLPLYRRSEDSDKNIYLFINSGNHFCRYYVPSALKLRTFLWPWNKILNENIECL